MEDVRTNAIKSYNIWLRIGTDAVMDVYYTVFDDAT